MTVTIERKYGTALRIDLEGRFNVILLEDHIKMAEELANELWGGSVTPSKRELAMLALDAVADISDLTELEKQEVEVALAEFFKLEDQGC